MKKAKLHKSSFHKKNLRDIKTWIENNLEKSIRVDDVVKISGYSKWYIQRLFKKEFGISMGAFIRSKRIELVELEIVNSQEGIFTIAVKHGFECQQSFTKIFTRYFKSPPMKWRNKTEHERKMIMSNLRQGE